MKSILAFGNFKPIDAYQALEKAVVFGVASRIQIRDFLRKDPAVIFPKSIGDFNASAKDGQLLIVDSEQCRIPQSDLRTTLAGFSFFLALPGGAHVLCHNVIEAMSAGTIPVIQAGYARLFSPELKDGETAIIFSSLPDLAIKIRKVFELHEDSIRKMRMDVITYYGEHLTPEAVVNSMTSGKYSKFYLFAERASTASEDLLRLSPRINETTSREPS